MAADKQPAGPVLVQRTIRHNLFSYDLPGGGSAIAMRNQTVDLLPHDVERGELYGAFTLQPGVPADPVGTLPDYPLEAVEAEQDAWVQSATAQEVLAAVNARPEIAASVLAAEQRRPAGARKTVLDALGPAVGGSS